MIFGPDYGRARAHHQIVGFADSLSLESAATPMVGPGARARIRFLIRRKIARRAFRRADELVVEAPHVGARLTDAWLVDPAHIHVVPNTPHSVFASTKANSHADSPKALREAHPPLIFFPTRAYPHKNIAILGLVGEELARRNSPAQFALTLHEDEWASLPESVRAHSLNLGPLSVSQLPATYAAMNAVIFPSLLESFSVTPLEAISCGIPLVASDRAFVRDVANGAALYADPTDPVALADAVLEALIDSPQRRSRVEHGRSIAEAWPSARDRALAYLSLIDLAIKA